MPLTGANNEEKIRNFLKGQGLSNYAIYGLIDLYKKLNCWEENDAYVPSAGDVIMYDWQDSGAGDNTGAPDHVGIVVSVSGKAMKRSITASSA